MKIVYSNSSEWEINALRIIQKKINEIIEKNKKCKLMLTGGSTASSIYKVWSNDFMLTKGDIEVYLTDERLVPISDKRNNYSSIINKLYQGNPPMNHRLFPVIRDSLDSVKISNYYNKIVPNYIDILMLSLGEDGHIASLFKNYNPSKFLSDKVISINAPFEPKARITITHNVLNNAHNTYLFVKGEKKAKIFKKVISNNKKYKYMSAKLLKNPIVFLDKIAYKIIYNFNER
jgi:6-phosphogluconolactonase